MSDRALAFTPVPGGFLLRVRLTPKGGRDAAEGPQVAVRDPGELFLELFHQLARDVKACVGAVKRLGGEAHGGEVAADRSVHVPGRTGGR